MPQPLATHTGNVDMLYAVHHLADFETTEQYGYQDDPAAFPIENNGLVYREDGALLIVTRADAGATEVTVACYSEEPERDAGTWEAVAEASVTAKGGELLLQQLTVGPTGDFPILSACGPGDYRVRIHARGRDEASHLRPDTVTEFYLLQTWPAPSSPPKLLRDGDRWGAFQREEITAEDL
ncbi:hypothetical protein [Streptacidiphilus jiangxiensis]|uniref:Uncharacterized protein n=1 Tax=Streptacidiphilus jiangxiensis TaxID=235985 RepID=A0A1H7I004_STRJI|nr:hypothetical protein [Streptacidiphilus jiangxiensis]SEK55886.1 hypothetical protein SAMN05414137_102440 [Streptacidiphilus jiangxiensis]